MANLYINWVNIEDPNDCKQAAVIATMFDEKDMDEDFDNTDKDIRN